VSNSSLPHDSTLGVSAAGVLGNDTAASGQPLTAVLLSGPGHGTLTLNSDGSFLYTADAGYSGSDSFTYYPGKKEKQRGRGRQSVCDPFGGRGLLWSQLGGSRKITIPGIPSGGCQRTISPGQGGAALAFPTPSSRRLST